MKHVINVGTDVASLYFFDPAALAADFDERMKAEGREAFEAAVAAGLLVWIEYDSDGGYTFHFYVEEAVPHDFRCYARKLHETESFHVPSGTIWACGAEYAARDPEHGRLAKYPHMGGHFSLPAGDYDCTTWEIDWPEDATEKALERAIGTDGKRWRDRTGFRIGWLLGGAVLAGLALLILVGASLFGHAWAVMGQLYAWPVFVTLVICIVALTRSIRRFDREHGVEEFEPEFPSFVVELRRKAA